MATILEKIIATKRKEIAQSKDALRADQLRAAIKDARETRNIHASLPAPEGEDKTIITPSFSEGI